MALPREMELLDMDQFETNKTSKSPARKFTKKKHGGKRNGVDGGEVGPSIGRGWVPCRSLAGV